MNSSENEMARPSGGKVAERREDPLRIVPRVMARLYSLWVAATYPFAGLGRDLTIHYTCQLFREHAPLIKLGNSVRIWKDSWLNVSARDEPGGAPVIVIDDNCHVARQCQISARNLVHLEQDVMLSPSVLLMDHTHNYEDITK